MGPWNLVSDSIAKDVIAKTAVEASNGSLPITAPNRLPTAPKLKARIDKDLMQDTELAEYEKLAAEIGLSSDDINIEKFRAFLAARDLPTFNYQEVVSYMDDIAAKDNPTKLGWHWCPVREKDAEVEMTFGRASAREAIWFEGSAVESSPASDFYESHQMSRWRQLNRDTARAGHPPYPEDWRTMRSPKYTRTIPLHALKKIALIEREFKTCKVLFLVTDYTLTPHVLINPDPFLMAVIPNSAVAHGKGRFIIDVWDEPGFGIERMVT